MSILSELKTIVSGLGYSVETGAFTETAPDSYVVLTPLGDELKLFCDDFPQMESCEVRISIYTKSNYKTMKRRIESALLRNQFQITSRIYIGKEDDTGYYHYGIDAEKTYKFELTEE